MAEGSNLLAQDRPPDPSCGAVEGPEHYSNCYTASMLELAEVARRTDEVTAHARAELVRAVRRASSQGLSQVEIAREIGRSQPEVSRLLHFHGRSSLALRLRHNARLIRRLVADAGGSHVRVFGSVATGQDGPHSDVDLLFTMGVPLSLMQLGRLERQISEIVGAPVDLVPESALRPDLRDRVMQESVLL